MSPAEEFLRHLRCERNLSPHTVRAYEGDLERWSGFLEGGEILSAAIDVGAVRRFLGRLHAEGYQKSSMARTLACLRTFYDYFLRRGAIEKNPVRAVRTPRLDKKLPRFLEEDEVRRLLESATGDTFTDLRDRALMETLYGGGLRVSEATGLDLGDLEAADPVATVRGKGGRSAWPRWGGARRRRSRATSRSGPGARSAWGRGRRRSSSTRTGRGSTCGACGGSSSAAPRWRACGWG